MSERVTIELKDVREKLRATVIAIRLIADKGTPLHAQGTLLHLAAVFDLHTPAGVARAIDKLAAVADHPNIGRPLEEVCSEALTLLCDYAGQLITDALHRQEEA